MPDVKLKNVSKTFDKGRIIAVDHIELHVRDREYLTLLGPSGCGKTTSLRMIAGLELPDEGEIFIGEKLVSNLPPNTGTSDTSFRSMRCFPTWTSGTTSHTDHV